jgi:2-keto-4-pentenoate hydratase/2-oxohepta-3-ene-1,7-dioic acid hydratase in catechol pathway
LGIEDGNAIVRTATVSGRTALITDDGAIDVAQASKGRFGSGAAELFERWPEVRNWARQLLQSPLPAGLVRRYEPAELGPPSTNPRQIFAIGLNYASHAAESGVQVSETLVCPPTFTKFVGSLSGPYTELVLPSDKVDWEVELVAVIGTRADRVVRADAWSHVAGLTVGQDFSERDIQRSGPVPQFSMGKSFVGFGPTGPWVVTPDEFADPDDLELECIINGETVQKSRTSAMIFSIPDLIASLSAICPLLPGDVIFTGTPAGVGLARTPEVYLKPGDEVVSRIEGIGTLRQLCVSEGV